MRDLAGLEEALRGADVVVHLAFLITGTAGRATTRATNIDGSLNAVRAAAEVGARRFVFASSVAALAGRLAAEVARLPVRLPVPVPRLPVHSSTRTTSVRRCCCASPERARRAPTTSLATACCRPRTSCASLGLTPVPVPGLLARAPACAVTALAALPFAPEVLGWAEVVGHPAVMDTTKAKRELGWRPRCTGLEALRTTVRGVRQGTTGVIS